MTVKQILALSEAGFTAEQITLLADTLTDEPKGPAEPVPEEPKAEPKEEPKADPKPQEDETPAWFGKFLQKYTADYEELAKGVQARNVRRAGDGPGVPEKTPEQLMAEAYNNIR